MPIAKPGDPLVTRGGQVLLSKDAIPSENPNEEITTIGPPKILNYQSKQRRSIKELPAEGAVQTGINAILVYSLLGLSDNEIAHITNASISDIRNIKNHPAYQDTFEHLYEELISISSNSMRSKIAAYAPKALENMMDIASNAKNENARQKANADILDRSGLHYETLHHSNKADSFDSLQIHVIEENDNKTTNIKVDLKRK